MEKPTVTYTDTDPSWQPRVGLPARVQVLVHPRFTPGSWVYTSIVIAIDGAAFETFNTRYTPGIIEEDVPDAIVKEIPHGIH